MAPPCSTHTQWSIHEMHNNEGESVSTYPHRPKAEAFDNVVDVVELLLAPTDQVPNVRHLRILHTFNTMICRLYVHHRKKLVDKGQRKFGSPFNLGDFPLETMKLPRWWFVLWKACMTTFLPGHGEVIPWHHTRRHVFSKHVFHFCIVVNPVNDAFMVDYCHTFPWNICPFLVKGMRMY